MTSSVILWGGYADLASFLARFVVGVFFAISGFHKLFEPARHARLRQTLIDDGIPFIRFNEWFVPIVEFLAGIALAVGFLSHGAAFLLFCISLVALLVDGVPRIEKKWHPINRADWMCCALYLPETLYMTLLGVAVLLGPGAFSVDALLWG